jgi:hypothetical protein
MVAMVAMVKSVEFCDGSRRIGFSSLAAFSGLGLEGSLDWGAYSIPMSFQIDSPGYSLEDEDQTALALEYSICVNEHGRAYDKWRGARR